MAVKSAGLGVALAGAVGLFAYPAQAAAPSSGSVTISAVIAPVRSVLVDSHGAVQEIVSNTSLNIAPTVYENSFTASPIPLTPAITAQYANIISRTNLQARGVVYITPTAAGEQPSLMATALYPDSYPSLALTSN